jgi:hypothetical protein
VHCAAHKRILGSKIITKWLDRDKWTIFTSTAPERAFKNYAIVFNERAMRPFWTFHDFTDRITHNRRSTEAIWANRYGNGVPVALATHLPSWRLFSTVGFPHKEAAPPQVPQSVHERPTRSRGTNNAFWRGKKSREVIQYRIPFLLFYSVLAPNKWNIRGPFSSKVPRALSSPRSVRWPHHAGERENGERLKFLWRRSPRTHNAIVLMRFNDEE